MKTITSSLFMLFYVLVGQAQIETNVRNNDNQSDCEVCKAVLVPDYLNILTTNKVRLSYLATIDETNWSEESSQFALAAIFPLFGVPVEAKNSWETTKEAKTHIFKSTKFDYEHINHQEVLRIALSQQAYSSFNECVKAACGSQNERAGVHIYITRIGTDDNIEVTLLYNTPPGSGQGPAIIQADEPMNLIRGSRLPEQLTSGQSFHINYKRNKRHLESQIMFYYKNQDGTIGTTENIHITPIHSYITLEKQETDTFSRLEGKNLTSIVGGFISDKDDEGSLVTPYTKCVSPTHYWCPNATTGAWVKEELATGVTIQFKEWNNPNCGLNSIKKGWYITKWGNCCCGQAAGVGAGNGNRGLQSILFIVKNDEGEFSDKDKVSGTQLSKVLKLKPIPPIYPR